MNKDSMFLSQLLTRLRKMSGLSQQELAQKAEISFRSYQRIEAGDMSPRMDLVFRILEALDVDPTQVFLDVFNGVVPGVPQCKMGASNINTLPEKWQRDLQLEPMVVAHTEIEGLKRALSGDYERGIAKIGYWEWNITSKKFYWSSQMYEIYQLEKSDPFNHTAYFNRFHPDDVAEIERDLDRLLEFNIPYENIHRIILDSGEEKRVKAIAKKFCSKNNEFVIFGIAERVSD